MNEARERIARRLDKQSRSCASLGSPLYAFLLERAARDAVAGGSVWRALEGRDRDPRGSALALRFMGAVHRLVLEGRAPELAAHYPSAGGHKGIEGAWPAFVSTIVEHGPELRRLLDRPVQTNEVGRAAGLVGGFLTVANRTGLPMRVLEIGASAGLLLHWDRYRYEARGATWGPEDSPVRLCSFNSERPLPFDVDARVVERAGCDRSPLDPTIEPDRLTLLSYVWPDQLARIRLLRAAIEVANESPVEISRAAAGDWLTDRLWELGPGIATVVCHSIVLQYLEEAERDRVLRTIEEAGTRATETSPLAWLRLEPGGEVANVHLTMWPSGEEHLVATCSYHGNAVRWLGFSG